MQWNPDDGTLDIGLPGGTAVLQVGQETQIRVRNEEVDTILNGRVVYASSASGNNKYVKRANSSSITELS